MIKLRLELSKINLRNYINRFFKYTKFNSQYIYINIKVNIDGSQNMYELGSKTLIDLNNKGDVKKFKHSILETFMKYETKPKADDIITIYYRDSNKDIYNKFIKEIYKDHDLENLMELSLK